MYKVLVVEIFDDQEEIEVFKGELRGIVGPSDYVNRKFDESLEMFGEAGVYIHEEYNSFEDAAVRMDGLVETSGVIVEDYIEFE